MIMDKDSKTRTFASVHSNRWAPWFMKIQKKVKQLHQLASFPIQNIDTQIPVYLLVLFIFLESTGFAVYSNWLRLYLFYFRFDNNSAGQVGRKMRKARNWTSSPKLVTSERREKTSKCQNTSHFDTLVIPRTVYVAMSRNLYQKFCEKKQHGFNESIGLCEFFNIIFKQTKIRIRKLSTSE